MGGSRKTEKEKEEDIWRKKISFWQRARKTEKEKYENIGRRKNIFFQEKKNSERKGGKYLEKEKCFFSGEEKRRRKRMKIFGEGKTFFRRRKRGKCHYSGTNE